MQILAQKTGNETIIWQIDGNGEVLGFTYNNEVYYYLKNAQGDVVGIANSAGTVVATYAYDSWGKLVNTPTGIGEINPLRYRGYYYDSETELYYLNARYYDPETGRFISADDSLSDLNLFRYCGNNPINFVDYNGLALIPLRKTAEGQGFTAIWNQKTKTMTVTGGADGPVKFKIGIDGTCFRNGTTHVEDRLYYYSTMLTSADKEAGVTVTKKILQWYKDFSAPVNAALKNAVQTFKNHAWNFVWFKSQVESGAAWDIKLPKRWNETIAANTFPGSATTEIIVNGAIRTPEQLGNMTYGYLGTAAGFTPKILSMGGHYAAAGGIMGVFTGADSVEDQAYISIGIDWYND